MDVKQPKFEDTKVTSQENKSQTTLRIINNIQFTSREIDIIAYLLGGRAPKKIASFLEISPKTVENHIRNIMLKLGCNSREGIIDFIEKTDKFTLIKKHYSDLLIKITFEQELKKIAAKLGTDSLHCLIFYYKKQRIKDPFIGQLEKHLELAGIKTCSKIWEQGQAKPYLTKNIGPKPLRVIYSMSDEFIEQLKAKNCNISTEAASLIPIVKQDLGSIIFLITEDKIHPNFQQELAAFTQINLTENQNYYLSVFDILQKLLPINSIDKNILEFNQQCSRFLDSSTLSTKSNEILEIKKLKKECLQNKPYKHYKKPMLIGGIIIILVFIYGLVLVFNKNKEWLMTNLKFQNLVAVKSNPTNESMLTKTDNVITKFNNINSDISLNLPVRNIKFIERNNTIAKIKDGLNKQKDNMAIQVISGLGGIGKTQLAAEFAYQAREENCYGAILWVTAGSYDSINNSYREFAEGLRLNARELNLAEMQKFVHLVLAKKIKGTKILLILDNVPNNHVIQNYLKTLQNQLAPYATLHILITSRSQDWAENPLLLDVFTKAEAAEFIKMYLPNEKAIAIANLGKNLNYFPLALSQALAYIKAHTNIDDYLEAYIAKKEEYLNKFQGDSNQYVESLWKTWNIALSKLSKNARKLLYISAYLDPEDIPLEFFSDLTAEERMVAVGELREHSFIILSHDNRSFKMHKLLQEVIRLTIRLDGNNFFASDFKNKFFGKEYWLTQALDLIENKFDFNYLQVNNWRLWSKYLAHARIISERAITTQGLTLKRGIKLYAKVAMFMTHILMESENSVNIWLKLLKLTKEQYNSQYNSILIAKINTYLGTVNRWANNSKDAKIALDEAIFIYLQAHTKTTIETQELINILRLLPLPNKTKLSDAIKHDFGYALTQLGKLYSCSLGQYDEALLNYNKAFMVFKDIENPTNVVQQSQAFTYIALAMFNNRIGEFQEADKLFKESLRIMSSFLPREHYLLNTIKVNIGSNAYMLGDIKRAEILLKKSVSYKYALNAVHSQWLSKFYLGRIYEGFGNYKQALLFLKESLIMVENHYQKTLHNFTAFHISRAEFWPMINKNSNIAYWKEALALTSKLFGEKHYQTARYHFLLGQALANKQQIKQAKEQYELAMIILNAEQIKHPNLIKFYQQNVQITKELGGLTGLNVSIANEVKPLSHQKR